MSARADQSRSGSERAASVRAAGSEPQQLLLPVLPGDGGESGTDAAAGRVAPGAAGVWHSQADGAAAPGGFDHQPQASGTAASVDGDRGDLRQAAHQSDGAQPSDLSLSDCPAPSDSTPAL